MKKIALLFIFLLPGYSFAQPFAELKMQNPAATSSIALPKLKWKGDLRVRTQQETTWSEDSRTSERLRLRFGVQAEWAPDFKTEIRLATSRSNNSTNQTLGDNKEPGAPRRFVGLDLAYADWKALSFLKVGAGRIPQSHERPGGSQILLDADLALEGVALVVEHPYSESLGIFGNFGSSWIRENYDSYYSQEQTDNMLNWGQAGLRWKADDWSTRFGVGFFNYTALQGLKFSDVSTGGTNRGNSEAAPGVFKNDYNPRQYFVDSKFKISSYQVGTFIEYLVNGETFDSNKAWWVGAILGQGNWSVQLAFAELGSDAVPALFTDSDFAGGTTAAKGYVLSGQWKVKKHLSLGFSQYMNRKQAAVEDTQYARTHLDLIASF